MTTLQYTLNDYNGILFGGTAKYEEPMTYKLPADIINKIISLSKKVGFNMPVAVSHKVIKRGNRMDDSWIARDFKPTTIIDKKEGKNSMNDIRIALNKISNKNYDANRDLIVEKINELITENTSNVSVVANNIFEIASTNKFFSNIYSKLYKELTEKFPEIFKDILNTFIQGFTETMKSIRYVDQNENYDEFCKYNKENDKRKATSVFITNLIVEGVVDKEVLTHILTEILSILWMYMDEANRTNEVEEITENIFLLLTSQLHLLTDVFTEHVEILDKIKQLASMKPKEKVSISSRAIFKYMDVLEKYNKSK